MTISGLSRHLATLGALTLAAAGATAQTLADAWRLAQAGEPGLQAARHQLQAALERVDQARSAMLPQISASVSSNFNNRNYEQEAAPGGPSVSHERFNSNSRQINLTQPLWRSANRAGESQSVAGVRQARAQFEATAQELRSNVVAAWFEAAAARDGVEVARQQQEVARQQLVVHERGLALGASSEVQRDEAAGRLGQARAEELQASSEYRARVARLRQLTGPMDALASEAFRWPLPRPGTAPPPALDASLEMARQRNAAVLGAQAAADAARDEVRKQQAQHEPSVDLVGSTGVTSQSGTGNFPGQSGYRNRQQSIGVQLNMPLYAGGGHAAKVREAVAQQAKAEADVETALRNAELQVRQSWAAIESARLRGPALEQSLKAARVALAATRRGVELGLKTPADELQARHQLASALRERNRGAYDLQIHLARLRHATGELDDAFIDQLQAGMLPDESVAGTAAGPVAPLPQPRSALGADGLVLTMSTQLAGGQRALISH